MNREIKDHLKRFRDLEPGKFSIPRQYKNALLYYSKNTADLA